MLFFISLLICHVWSFHQMEFSIWTFVRPNETDSRIMQTSLRNIPDCLPGRLTLQIICNQRLWLTVTSKFNHSNWTKITTDARFQIQRTTTKKQCFKRKMQLNLMWLLFQAHVIVLQYKTCYKYFKIIFHNSQLIIWKQNPEFVSSLIKIIWSHRNQV